MKHRIAFIFFVALLFSQGVAQESSKSLASTLDVSVFPADGQAADQQSKNEAECYSWAGGDTGNDPFELQKQTEQQHE